MRFVQIFENLITASWLQIAEANSIKKFVVLSYLGFEKHSMQISGKGLIIKKLKKKHGQNWNRLTCQNDGILTKNSKVSVFKRNRKI